MAAAVILLLDSKPVPAGRLTPPESVVLCAPCHNRQDNDQVGEWLASPYSQAEGGRGCVDCHGWRCSGTSDYLTGKGATVEDLRKPGAAARVTVSAVCTVGVVEVEVAVTNLGAGHDLPTGPPGRALVMEVTANQWDGAPLPPRVPPGHSAYAATPTGALKRIFVKHPPGGNSENHRSRLAPFEADVSRYRFTLSERGPAQIRVRLILVPTTDPPFEIATAVSACSPPVHEGEEPP